MHLSQLNTSTMINSLQTVSSAFLLSRANYSYQKFDVTYGHCRVQKSHVQFCWLGAPLLFQIHNLQAVAKESQVQVVIDAIHISRLLKKDVYFLYIQGNCPETLSVFQSLRLSLKRPLGGTTSAVLSHIVGIRKLCLLVGSYRQHRQQSLKFICGYFGILLLL